MAKTFNPFDREPAFLQLGDKSYQVLEATRGVMRRVQNLQNRLESLDEQNADEAISLFAEIVSCAVENGNEASSEIIRLWETDVLSIGALARCVKFIGDELQGSASLGEE